MTLGKVSPNVTLFESARVVLAERLVQRAPTANIILTIHCAECAEGKNDDVESDDRGGVQSAHTKSPRRLTGRV